MLRMAPSVPFFNLELSREITRGGLHFGPDGMLYIAVGENATPSNSQSIANRLGKILRINSNGTIPSNPTTFPGIAGSPSGDNTAIWSVGLRNPYTFDFQPGTGRMFINDVGQVSWEEINDGIAGSNYGWSICEGSCSPPNANYRDPLFSYGHGISPTPMCDNRRSFLQSVYSHISDDYIGKYSMPNFAAGGSGGLTGHRYLTGLCQAFLTSGLKVGRTESLHTSPGGGGAVFQNHRELDQPISMVCPGSFARALSAAP